MTGLETMENKTAITLFGGTGDLTYRKLLPALYNLNVLGKLADDFKIVVIGRRAYTQSEYIDIARTWVKEYARTKFDDEQFDAYVTNVKYPSYVSPVYSKVYLWTLPVQLGRFSTSLFQKK